VTTPPWGQDPQQPGQPYQPYGAPYPPSNPYGPPAGYGYQPPKPTNGLAIGSMVTSIAGAVFLCLYGVGGIVGLVGAILGHVAMRQIKANDQNGRGMALAGVIVGWIAFALMIVIVAVIVIFFIAVSDDCYTDSSGYYQCS
jgi:hypothetical protein